eukprot:TRINITY_DN1517_c3_g1_i1.p1 TRINITY_DN1517_c3_g1~~TRINITY_DN1517_c3_g1_i1.p1  ORF type:complete len:426 (+),score=66.87 TRINITY_DN1517_c3_g1_i1:81-1358(+)
MKVCTLLPLLTVAAANPFIDDKETAVHTVTKEEMDKFVKTTDKNYHVMLLATFTKELKESCTHCTWMEKQHEALAEAYINQYNGGRIYDNGGKRVYFAKRLLTKQPKNTRIPSVTMYTAGKSKGELFGASYLTENDDDWDNLKKSQEEKLSSARKDASKTFRSIKRADQRRERRKRSLSTQEIREEPQYGIRDAGMPNMNNFCKWVRLTTQNLFYECPQDVDRNIASTEAKSETGKHILIFVVGLSGVLYLFRAFGVVLPRFNSSEQEKLRLRHMADGVAKYDDNHVHGKFIDPYWNFLTNVGFFVSLIGVSCCVSGMYHNFLNKQELLGGPFQPPFSKFTGYRGHLPMHSVAIAVATSYCAIMMLALGRMATSNYALIKIPAIPTLMFLWLLGAGFIGNLFVDRNTYYLSSSKYAEYLPMILRR